MRWILVLLVLLSSGPVRADPYTTLLKELRVSTQDMVDIDYGLEKLKTQEVTAVHLDKEPGYMGQSWAEIHIHKDDRAVLVQFIRGLILARKGKLRAEVRLIVRRLGQNLP